MLVNAPGTGHPYKGQVALYRESVLAKRCAEMATIMCNMVGAVASNAIARGFGRRKC